MKKGQIREGIVMDVKFPNKGNVKLMPAAADEEAKGSMRKTARRKEAVYRRKKRKNSVR